MSNLQQTLDYTAKNWEINFVMKLLVSYIYSNAK